MNLDPIFNWLASVVRTSVVPAVVGVIAAASIYSGTDIPAETAVIITTGITFAYWAVVRALESRFPRAGWLLLMPRPPAYTAAQAATFVRSAVRTFSPLVVGSVAAFLARNGVDTQLSSSVLAVLASGGYYGLARIMETYAPSLGLLLGMRGAPTYVAAEPPVADEG